MTELELVNDIEKAHLPRRTGADYPGFRHVLACVDTSVFAQAVLAHAAAVAAVFDARLTVMRVLEPSAEQTPTDPVEWMMRHRDAKAELDAQSSWWGGLHADAVVIGGLAAERICNWVRENGVDLTVLGAGGDRTGPFAGLGSTARRVAEAANASVMVVPSTGIGEAPLRYQRVMTPLDGSSRSECALPIALGIAVAHDAELVLVHAVPNVELTEIGPLESEAIGLRDQLRRRNERVADKYLRQVKSRLPRTQTATRARVLTSRGPRHALAQAAEDNRSDIVVMSSTGRSGHSDLSVGSVADYLINHVVKPILLVRGHECAAPRAQRSGEDPQAVRLPDRALM